jgi:hypothetical protein
MLRRITTAGFFWLRLCPNFLLGLSALKGATFLRSQAKVSTDLKILWIWPRGCARTTGSEATSRGADLQEVWAMHHWVLLLVWVRTFGEEVGTDGQGSLTQRSR